jgi:hypothetical protein
MPMASKELEFGIGSDEDWASTMEKANNSPLAKSAGSPALRSLVAATVMENDEWFYEAQRTYAGLQQKGADNLAKMMHAAFWMRYGFRRLAEKAAQG